MNQKYQVSVLFPDWKGYVDDSLAMNRMVGFTGCKGQGSIHFAVQEPVTGFTLYINNRKVETKISGPGEYTVDVSAYTIDGKNSLQISDIKPSGVSQKIGVNIPFPVVSEDDINALEALKATDPAAAARLQEELLLSAGICPETIRVIEAIVESDVRHGFPSAQMALIRNGKLVYRNAWGKLNSYEQDGMPKKNARQVTKETLYDLASNTKMYSANYAIQYLVSEGRMDIEKKITDFLGERFADNIMRIDYEGCENPPMEIQQEWKRSLTVKDVLRHQAGFPADPRFFCRRFDQAKQERADVENVLFTGDDGSPETKARTLEAICRTPLMYRPGTKTVYSDADYMLLGFLVEQVTGTDLNTFLKETFWEPMGLKRITFNPLEHGFTPEDCAATELNGNSRDGAPGFESPRSETLQGKVHDEKSWCNMGGISGHAGLFASATDLAKLAFVMLCGGYGTRRFFTKGVLDWFTAPQRGDTGNWGLGWTRQGDMERAWYFSPLASRGTVGHQGWTGTLSMIDPEKNLVLIFLTNKINSPVTDKYQDPNRFDGNWFTTSTLGPAAQLIYLSFCGNDPHEAICALLRDMAEEKQKLVDAAGDAAEDPNHPVRRAKAALDEVVKQWNPEV